MDFTKCVTLVGALLLLGVFLPSEACSCKVVDHLQNKFCDASAVIKATFIKESQRNKVLFGFDSQTHEVLKGNAALQNSTFIVNTEPRYCTYNHPPYGYNIPYLVAGSIENDGNVGVMGCSKPKPWRELTPKQIAGLKEAYRPGCGTCEITTCDTAPCEPEKDKCRLEVYKGGDSKNQKENQACLRNEKGICAWKTIQ